MHSFFTGRVAGNVFGRKQISHYVVLALLGKKQGFPRPQCADWSAHTARFARCKFTIEVDATGLVAHQYRDKYSGGK